MMLAILAMTLIPAMGGGQANTWKNVV